MTAHPDPGLFERFDLLSAEARSDLLGHAAGCAACRGRLLEADPSRLFALLAVQPVPGAALERLSAGLGEELDRVAPRRRLPSRFRGAAALAASLFLAGFFGLYLTRVPQPGFELAAVPDAAPATLAADRKPPANGIQLISSPGRRRCSN